MVKIVVCKLSAATVKFTNSFKMFCMHTRNMTFAHGSDARAFRTNLKQNEILKDKRRVDEN